ncbi:MAG: PEP-CTERM system TPR-repeat protein PrsT [Azonexus sp.]|nr:PEP-CTERM system TPR-repeat protein PrsT [Azonexus sp.]
MKPHSSLTLCAKTLLTALLVASTSPGFAAIDTKASRYYEDALVRYNKKDIPGAIIQLKNALQIDKNMLQVQVLLGKALMANSDVIPAEVAFREALRLGVSRAEVVVPLARSVMAQGRLQEVVEKPLFATADLPAAIQSQLLLLLASAHLELGKPTNAMKAIEEARAIDPASADPWLAEAQLRIRSHQFREAQAAVDRALLLAPNSAQALYTQGMVEHSRGEVGAALANYTKALQAQPGHTESLVARAGLLLDLGRLPEASTDITESLRKSPDDPRALYLSSLIADRSGNQAAAKEALNKVTSILDRAPLESLRFRPQVLVLGGLAHYGLKQNGKARSYLEAAQRSQPGIGVAKLLAQIYLSEKNVDGAIDTLDTYLKAQPNDAQALLLLASAHMSQGRHGRATQLMQSAMRTQDRPDFQAMLGISLVGGGKFGDAFDALESAFRKDPGQMQAGVALANLYLKGGQSARAVSVAESLAKQRPGSAGVQNLLGMARAGIGDRVGAKTAFYAAVKLDASFIEPQVNLARLEIDAKDYDSASKRLKLLLSRDEKNLDAIGEMARVFEFRGQLAEAQRWLEKAVDFAGPGNIQPGLALVEFQLRNNNPSAAQLASKGLTGKDPEALPVLLASARTSLANGDALAARTSLSRAATQATRNPPVLLQVALLQSAAGHTAGAAYSLEKALLERPDFLPAQALMAEMEIRQSQFDKAEQHVRQIIASHPQAAVGYGLQGDLATARGQRQPAIDAYRRAHEIEQSTASLLRLYGVLAPVDGPSATQLVEQWVKSHPQDVDARRTLADGHARLGSLQAARTAYEALLKITPNDAEVLNNLANVLVLIKDPGALKVAEQALALKPAAPHIISTVGWAAFKSGQTDRALQFLRDARLRDPADRDTRYFLGVVLASSGRPTEARMELEAALSGDRQFSSAKDAEQLLRTLK